MLMVNNLSGFGAGEAEDLSGLPLIDVLTRLNLTANLWFVGDAGDANSAPNGATQWLDTSGGGNDFHRGTTTGGQTTDPTFNGTPGGLSSAEYWSFDGGDFFTYEATPPAAVQFQKNGATFTLGCWIYRGTGTVGQRLLAGRGTTSAGYAWNVRPGGTDSPQWYVYDNSLATEVIAAADNGVPVGQWSFMGLSVNENGGAVSFHYLNGNYNPVGGHNTWDSAYPSPGTADLVDLRIGAYDGTTQPLVNGTRLAQFFIYAGTALTKSDFDSIYNATQGRFGL